MRKVLLVGGSPNPDSQSSRVLRVLETQLRTHDIEVEFLSVRQLPAQDLIACQATTPEVRQSITLLEAATGVILATPIYKSSISGLLKLWLDLLSQHAFRQKVILPIATGGSAGSVLALDAALSPIVTSMGSLQVLPGFFVLEEWIQDQLNGTPQLALPQRIEPVFRTLIQAFVTAVERGPLENG